MRIGLRRRLIGETQTVRNLETNTYEHTVIILSRDNMRTIIFDQIIACVMSYTSDLKNERYNLFIILS